MAEGFIQLNPDVDATGKQLDNDVVQIPAGTVITDGLGNQTTLAAPAYYFRERIVSADPNDPRGVANVRNDVNGSPTDYALVGRIPFNGSPDLSTIASLLGDIDNNIAVLTQYLASGAAPAFSNYAFPIAGPLSGTGIQSPGVPRQVVCDIFGRVVMIPHATREIISNATITITSTTAAQTLIAAPGINTFADLVAVIGINTSATATELDLSDGTQTVTMYLPAGDMRGISLGGVIIKATTPNIAWTATTITSVASVKVWATYVQNRVQ